MNNEINVDCDLDEVVSGFFFVEFEENKLPFESQPLWRMILNFFYSKLYFWLLYGFTMKEYKVKIVLFESIFFNIGPFVFNVFFLNNIELSRNNSITSTRVAQFNLIS